MLPPPPASDRAAMSRFVTAALLLVSLAAWAQPAPDNFVQWRKGLASSAQPGADWLRKARENGYEVVVNLAPPQSMGSIREEGGIVGATGITYVNIPVDFRHPTAEDFRFFSEVLRANASRNVLVHCQVNLRGSSFTFLYRVLQENADIAEARAKLLGVWTPDSVWREFIEKTLRANGKSADLL
jgi:protein tyrosine phosphatase (PTP) superfamily phosphohydrolase (DUF442 family)